MHDQLIRAQEFAAKVHQNQFYDRFPYFKHLEDVYNVLVSAGYSEDTEEGLNILTAAWLHDCMEDRGVSYSDLKRAFNEDVAEIVFCVTDEIGRNRHEKKEKTYPKIRSNPDAIIVKVADRIANVKNSVNKPKSDNDFLSMYRKEHKKFKWILQIPGHATQLWETLDNLLVTKVKEG